MKKILIMSLSIILISACGGKTSTSIQDKTFSITLENINITDNINADLIAVDTSNIKSEEMTLKF